MAGRRAVLSLCATLDAVLCGAMLCGVLCFAQDLLQASIISHDELQELEKGTTATTSFRCTSVYAFAQIRLRTARHARSITSAALSDMPGKAITKYPV
mmetsp:Transcript_5850/g.18779  ORF Transcript_5850/g.18779 Transcript_5850/m.18779 type:complete len:98 (+) Transcript_5850:132-425(+)